MSQKNKTYCIVSTSSGSRQTCFEVSVWSWSCRTALIEEASSGVVSEKDLVPFVHCELTKKKRRKQREKNEGTQRPQGAHTRSLGGLRPCTAARIPRRLPERKKKMVREGKKAKFWAVRRRGSGGGVSRGGRSGGTPHRPHQQKPTPTNRRTNTTQDKRTHEAHQPT